MPILPIVAVAPSCVGTVTVRYSSVIDTLVQYEGLLSNGSYCNAPVSPQSCSSGW